MNTEILKSTTIREYLDMLKRGDSSELSVKINEALSNSIDGIAGGFDLQLFQLHKDSLLLQCKYLLAMLEFDGKKMEMYAEKIEKISSAIAKKSAKQSNSTPYESFLMWLLTLKKYFGSDIDQSNDLMCLVVATKQMMQFYRSQNESIKDQKK